MLCRSTLFAVCRPLFQASRTRPQPCLMFCSSSQKYPPSNTNPTPSQSPFEVNSARQMKIAEQRIEKSSNYNNSRDSTSPVPTSPRKEKHSTAVQRKEQPSRNSSAPATLKPKEVEKLLPSINTVRNYYKVLDQFSPQNFLDIADNMELISDPKSALILNNVWTYARKYRLYSTYKTPAFETMARTIANNLSVLQVPENVAGFAINLHKVNHQDIEPYQKIEQYVSEHLETFPLTSLAQIAYAFTTVSRSQVIHDFSQFYGRMQIVIALKLRDAVMDENVNINSLSKDFSQILSGYSKTQNLSKEFIYVLEQFILNHIASFKPREKMITLHSFTVNNHLSKPLIDSCIYDFMKAPEALNIQELCHLATSLNHFDMLTSELSLMVKEQFILKKNQSNLLDLADICSVFFGREEVDEEFFEVVRGIFRTLRANVELNVLYKLLTNASSLLNKEFMPHRFFKTLIESLQIISFEKSLHGRLIDELKEDARKVLHPQFKQLYLDTLNNLKQIDYKKKRTDLHEQKQNKESKEEDRKIRHFKLQASLKTRRTQNQDGQRPPMPSNRTHSRRNEQQDE